LNDNSLDLATPVEDKSDPVIDVEVIDETAKALDEEPIIEPVAVRLDKFVGLEEPANPVAIQNPVAIDTAKPKQRKPRKKQTVT
jgi:hypothetical protein